MATGNCTQFVYEAMRSLKATRYRIASWTTGFPDEQRWKISSVSWRAAQKRKESWRWVSWTGDRKGKVEGNKCMRLHYIITRRQRKQLCQCTNWARLHVADSIYSTAVVVSNFLDAKSGTHFCQRAVL